MELAGLVKTRPLYPRSTRKRCISVEFHRMISRLEGKNCRGLGMVIYMQIVILVYMIWNPNRIIYKQITPLYLGPCSKPAQTKPGTTSPIYALVPIKCPLVAIVPP